MKNFLFTLLVGLAIGCSKHADNPTPVTNNTITFGSTDWLFYPGNFSQDNPNNYVSNQASMGNTYTLSLSAAAINDTSAFSYWLAGFVPAKELTPGQSLVLRSRVRLENVQGTGVAIALRGDTGIQRGVLFASTQTQKVIRGTADFTEYTLTLPYTKPVDAISLYLLLLPKTTGTVTFSNTSVETK